MPFGRSLVQGETYWTGAYVDGGAQVCVITESCVESLGGLPITGNSGFKVRMANHQKVKCLGFIQNL